MNSTRLLNDTEEPLLDEGIGVLADNIFGDEYVRDQINNATSDLMASSNGSLGSAVCELAMVSSSTSGLWAR